MSIRKRPHDIVVFGIETWDIGELESGKLMGRQALRIFVLSLGPFNGDGTGPEIENPASALREAGLSSLQAHIRGRLQDYGDRPMQEFATRIPRF